MTASAPGRPAGPWLRRLAGDRAQERIHRALAFGFLPAGALFGLLAAPAAAAQAPRFPAWWNDLALTLGIAPSLVLGVGAFLLPITALRRIALAAAVFPIVVQASVPVVVRPWPEANGQAWFLQIVALGLIAAALAMSPGRAVLVAAIGSAVVAATRGATDHVDAVLQGVQDGLYVLLFTITFLALGFGALQAAQLTDAEEAEAAAAAAAAAADDARERERSRVNALVHDRVLATLLAAARPVPGSSALERADAQRALDGLRALLVADAPTEPWRGETLVWRVQATTTALAPEAVFGYDLDADLVVPGDVADTILQAGEEALRNSLRHAAASNRTVHVRIGADGVDVDVLDDGIGFDRAAVPPERLGITESIEGRMRALPGGRADVITRPGVGTRVLLRWSAP